MRSRSAPSSCPSPGSTRSSVGERLLAFGGLIALLGLGWSLTASPMLHLYDARAAAIAERADVLANMTRLAATLPALRSEADTGPPAGLLAGDTDAVAAASLQNLMETTAKTVGVNVERSEVLASKPQGHLHLVALRIALTTSWPELVNLLQALENNPARLHVDDLQLHATSHREYGEPDGVVEASFALLGARAVGPAEKAEDVHTDAGKPTNHPGFPEDSGF